MEIILNKEEHDKLKMEIFSLLSRDTERKEFHEIIKHQIEVFLGENGVNIRWMLESNLSKVIKPVIREILAEDNHDVFKKILREEIKDYFNTNKFRKLSIDSLYAQIHVLEREMEN